MSDSCDPMDYSMPGSSVHDISLVRILQWVAIYFSRGSSQPRDWTCVSCIGRQILLPLSCQGSPRAGYQKKRVSEWALTSATYSSFFCFHVWRIGQSVQVRKTLKMACKRSVAILWTFSGWRCQILSFKIFHFVSCIYFGASSGPTNMWTSW